MQPCQPRRRGSDLNRFGRGHDTSPFPSEVPTPGRWIRSDRTSARGTRPRFLRLVDLSSNPIRWRPARRPRTEARPRRTDVSRVKKGIDKPRPVTEADVSSNGLVAFMNTRPRTDPAPDDRDLDPVLRSAGAIGPISPLRRHAPSPMSHAALNRSGPISPCSKLFSYACNAFP